MSKSGLIHPYERPRLLKAILLTVVAVKWLSLTAMFIYGLVSTKDLFYKDGNSYLSHYLVELFVQYLVLSLASLLALYCTLFEQLILLIAFAAINLIVILVDFLINCHLPSIIVFFIAIEAAFALFLSIYLKRRRAGNTNSIILTSIQLST